MSISLHPSPLRTRRGCLSCSPSQCQNYDHRAQKSPPLRNSQKRTERKLNGSRRKCRTSCASPPLVPLATRLCLPGRSHSCHPFGCQIPSRNYPRLVPALSSTLPSTSAKRRIAPSSSHHVLHPLLPFRFLPHLPSTTFLLSHPLASPPLPSHLHQSRPDLHLALPSLVMLTS